MRCADFTHPGEILFRGDATAPQPGTGEVLVAVRACGICGSDLHMFRDNSYRDKLVRETAESYAIPGHEFAGTIAALGHGVTGWAIGDRVVGVTGMGGGMADLVAVPDNPFQLVRIPDDLPFTLAATTEPLADGLQMVRKGAPADGENVVVIGVGIIGLGVIQAIVARGIAPQRIIAVDVHQARLDKALEVGATHAVNPRDGDVFDQIAALCGLSESYAGLSASVALVFDCAGYIRHMQGPPPLETALRLVNPNGRIVCFGGFEGPMTIDMSPLIQKQPTIFGSNGYAAEELVEALDLMRSGRVDRATLISHDFPLERIAESFAAQLQPEAVKVMLHI
ncbi:MAG: zinc-binding dehydrogenase [Sphingomonadales bacterium]|nr:zinc-binding dehydrogenase [Sphingomonadales bacterium]